MSTCFFIGHRDAPDSIYPSLLSAVEKHITQHGVTDFVVGHYGRFDVLAAKAVMTFKTLNPKVTLTLLLPYHPTERTILLPPGFDTSYYPVGMETVPRQYAIAHANRIMIDEADYLIAYTWHPTSNSHNLVEYAQKRGVPVTIIPRPNLSR